MGILDKPSYSKPVGGIPSSDLSSAVQTSLNRSSNSSGFYDLSLSSAFKNDEVLTVKDGELLLGGRRFFSVGVNAYELFTSSLSGSTAYQSDLATLAAAGVKIIRVALTMPTSGDLANWASYIGTNGAAPVSTYATKLAEFLGYCSNYDIKVIPCIFWRGTVDMHTVIPGASLMDFKTSGSPLRKYFVDFTRWLVRAFKYHRTLIAWEIGNEWDTSIYDGYLLTGRATPVPTKLAVIGVVAGTGGAIRVTTSATHNLVNGISGLMTGVTGTSEANGYWASVTVVSATVFELTGSTFTNAWVSGGVFEVDFKTPYISTINQIYDTIREQDSERAIIAPGSTILWRGVNNYTHMVSETLQLNGKCEVIAPHLYPDVWDGVPIASAGNLAVGETLVGARAYLTTLNIAARAVGKAVILGECNADYDNTLSYTVKSFDAAYNSGLSLALDWTWITSTGASNTNLKTGRAGAMALITSYNAAHTIPMTYISSVYPVVGSIADRSKMLALPGTTGSYVSVPMDNYTELTAGTDKLFVSFWLSNTSPYSGSGFVMSHYTSAPMGWYVGVVPKGHRYRVSLWLSTTPSSVYVELPEIAYGAAHHYAIYYAGNGVVHYWIDGLYAGRTSFTTPTGFNAFTNPSYTNMTFGSDVANGTLRKMNISDVIIGKDVIITSDSVWNYFISGIVPNGCQHRWKFMNDYTDSIGTSHGVPGSSTNFISSNL